MKTVISVAMLAVAAVTISLTAPVAASTDNYRANNYAERGLIPVRYAQHPRAGLREINRRQAEQRARIERGFRNGLITRMEFRRLMAEQHHLQSLTRAYLADGFLTYRERDDLRRRLDFASRHIKRESHDAQRRF